jgi:hypothetical protein
VQYLTEPVFHIGSDYITASGLIAFAVFCGGGLLLARLFPSQPFRRFHTRLNFGRNFVSIIPTVFSLATLIFFTVTAINGAGSPLAWNQPLPAISLTLVRIFLVVALLLVVWSGGMSYRPCRFRSDLNFAIARKLREAGIEIPGPQREINVRDGFVRVEQTGPEKEPESA